MGQRAIPSRISRHSYHLPEQNVKDKKLYHRVKKYLQKADEHILDVLHEAPRSGRPIKIDTRVEAHVTMIACSDPPAGYGRWTLHMIADKLVQLEVIDTISYESVRRTLKIHYRTVF